MMTENKMASEISNIVSDELDRGSATGTNSNKSKILKNLAALSLGFVLLFTAFQALANLQSTMNNAGAIGVISQSIIYVALIVSSLFLPKLVIKRFGCKRTVLFSVLTYSPYIAANFYPKDFTLFPTATLLGVGGGTLWSAACSYINDLSFMFANEDSEKAVVYTSMFFGAFTMCFQTTQIWGNLINFLVAPLLISFYVLRPSVLAPLSQQLQNNNNVSGYSLVCGASFCEGTSHSLEPVAESKRTLLVAIFLACSVVAAIVVGLFLDPLTPREAAQDDEESMLLRLIATFKQIVKTDQLLLIALTSFSGFQQGFLFTDFTEAYIACAWGVENVGLVFVCFGFVDAVMSVWCGRLVKFLPRVALVSAAAAAHAALFVALLLWRPDGLQPHKFYVVIGFWAFGDAIWQTQLSALYGVLFRSDEEAAFANFRAWEALGFMVAFGCSSALCIPTKVYMLMAFLAVGMAGYIAVELRICRRKKSYLIRKPFPFC